MGNRRKEWHPVVLNENETRERGSELAAAVKVLERREEVRKEVSKEQKDRVEEARTEVGRLAEIVKSGKETRQVDVEDRPDLRRSIMVTFRLDTGETVSSRPMTAAEIEDANQGRLFKEESVEDLFS